MFFIPQSEYKLLYSPTCLSGVFSIQFYWKCQFTLVIFNVPYRKAIIKLFNVQRKKRLHWVFKTWHFTETNRGMLLIMRNDSSNFPSYWNSHSSDLETETRVSSIKSLRLLHTASYLKWRAHQLLVWVKMCSRQELLAGAKPVNLCVRKNIT